MTDTQFGILISILGTGLAGIAAAIKWSVTRLTAALDSNTNAHLESVKAMTTMSTKLDFVYNATGKVDDFLREEKSGVHTGPEDITPIQTPRRTKSPVGGYQYVRPKTFPGEDK